MEKEKSVWVIGHKNPDTDSICAAIAYADLKNKTGKGFLNRWMTGIEFICLIGCFDPSSDSFYGNLGCLFLSTAVSVMLAWKKAKKLHFENPKALGAVLAQIFSPVSLLFLVIMIGRLMDKLKKDRKR